MSICEKYKKELINLRRWLHQHPELSMKERATSRYIYEYLQALNIPCTLAGDTGVIATLMVNPDFKTIAVRSEIDGLPIEEDTGLSFASLYPGRMHACGHDAITAVNLCLARVLSENREDLNYNVRFLFEPGEETGEGAKHIIAHGGLKNPDVSEILIFHFGNQETRHMEIQKNISTAAVCGITFHVKGKSTHWFQPEAGIDALYAASLLTVKIRKLNQTLKTEHPFVLGFGLFSAGTAGNIMADKAVLNGSLRAFTMDDFHYIWEELEKAVKETEEETGTVIQLEPGRMIPPIINNENLVKRGSRIGKEQMKEDFSLGEHPFLAGDNAAFYMEQVPGMRIVFLAGSKNRENFPVHNPSFDIEEDVFLDALEFLYSMVTDKGETENEE